MKKILYSVLIITILLFTILTVKSKAASLDNIQVNIDKTTVTPGEEITLTINFGKPLGAYTFDIAYDNNLLDYVGTADGTPNDNGTRVRVVYYDSSGGSNPKESMQIKFKVKEGIITSNPTNFSITAEGLSNPDASESYDDIGVPIVKDFIVEPKYEDYKFDLQYTGNPIINEEKEMILSLTSKMGKNYEHARIIAEATSTTGGNVQLLGTDENQLEHDLIDSGWGDAGGYKIGGQDVNKVLNLRGIFDKAGEYTLTFKLIDRDSSDAVITENSFKVTVTEKEITPPEQENPGNGETGENQENTTNKNEINNNINENINKNENLPKELPKTGKNIYIPILVIAIFIISTALYIKLRKNKKMY